MKTSLELPDDLYRRVKSKSALEGLAVREVAAALFAAWVDGRLSTELALDRPADGEAGAADPRTQWLARWRDVTDRVSAATPEADSLLHQLTHDRQ